MKELTIICPIYNEEECIPIFIKKIKELEKKLSYNYILNIYFSNNSSTDNSYKIIKEYSEKYNNIFYFTLSKNFGYQNSLFYSLKNVKGDLFIIIDVDGEDPPEMILDFVKNYEKGYDIVYGQRIDRKENYLIKQSRKFFYRILKFFSDDEIILDMAEFSIFTDEVRLSIIDELNSFPFLRSSIAKVGYNSLSIPYVREKRVSGKSNYNFVNMFKFAIAGILSSTTWPLRIPIYIFPIWTIYFFYILVNFISETNFDYIKMFLIITSYMAIFILTFLSVYLARLYKNSLARSNAYVIKKKSKLK